MAGGIFKKLIGGDSSQQLDSCCGSVNVTEEEEETPQAESQGKAETKTEETPTR